MILSIIESISSSEFNDGLSYTWTGYVEEGNKLSLFKLIEDNDDYFKGKYLDWVYSVGKYEIRGKSLVDHLSFKDGFSFWWMMPITEKSQWKSPYITDIIRLIAIEDIVKKHKPSKLRLQSNNSALNEVLTMFCKTQGIEYECHRLTDKEAMGFKSIFLRVLLAIRSIFSLLKYLFHRWPLRKQTKIDWINDDKSVFFCSYFFNLDHASLQNGEFRSKYWGDLHELLRDLNLKSNWLQLYHRHATIPNAETALNKIRLFNNGKQETHRFLDAYLSLNLILNVIRSLIQLMSRSFYLGSVKNAFKSVESGMSFWPLVRSEWYSSLFGPIAVSNILYYHLFEKAISDLPHQKIGLYIFEDQAWERAFIHSWRKSGHGKLIAVAHSTIRFWDFRYSTDSRMMDPDFEDTPLPFADYVAINGQAAIDNYLSTDNVLNSWKECEALRFLNIVKPEILLKRNRIKHKYIRVLILGDYLQEGTANLLNILQRTLPLLPKNFTFTLKPHPVNLVKAEDYSLLKFNIVYDALEDILIDYDIAYAGNSTSAAVDAYLTGMQVVVVLDELQLNVSPLRSKQNVKFVSTPEQLANALCYQKEQISDDVIKDFFFLDPKLPRWRKILTEQN